jgi:hypothetical protein
MHAAGTPVPQDWRLGDLAVFRRSDSSASRATLGLRQPAHHHPGLGLQLSAGARRRRGLPLSD